MRLHQLLEGRHDPHRLKAIFMLGSPGSGKSAVANRLIGGTGLRLVNSDTVYEWLTMGSENPIVATGFDDDLYRHSGRLMARRLDVWRREGLGLLIDVTGRNVTRLLKLKHDLEKQGYDTMAIFVNADLVTALNRNDARRRRVNPDWVRRVHDQVQKNLGAVQTAFRGNLVIVDNSEGADLDAIAPYKQVNAFLRQPTRPVRESLVDEKYGEHLHEIVEIIRHRAQPWMYAYGFRNLHLPFYRGVTATMNDDHVTRIGYLGFIQDTRIDRRPLHSPQELHDEMNRIIADAGGKANRSNSLFIVGDEVEARPYGRPFVVIPLGEISYTWADRWQDWFGKADDMLPPPISMREHVRQNTEDLQRFRAELRKAIRVDHGIEDAYQQRAEVMVKCDQALYLDSSVWHDVIEHYRNRLQRL